eukprot:CAMPEP_0119384474 /NCGR_PEP_ID=MMETSP1334-20130426/85633_1 /TAXON_ID=127549 /ORGANISM="Calcidiscus leptoporus, Strain RCC1130" /LENGTH=66 /DNA_ID=CAMNT_0007405493 /DNA_START=530 /DNA_END=727 /DNA_ORIENTATION=-
MPVVLGCREQLDETSHAPMLRHERIPPPPLANESPKSRDTSAPTQRGEHRSVCPRNSWHKAGDASA